MRVIVILFFILNSLSCQTDKAEFRSWKEKNIKTTATKLKKDTAIFYSTTLLIDTIYRSMQGPFESKKIQINSGEENIVYITGYKSEVIDIETDSALPSIYMCHSNLNYFNKDGLPWELKTSGANGRIFTLSNGQLKLDFPEGFGIPVQRNQEFRLVSQVLNHLEEEINLKVKHKVEIEYVKESKETPIVPLFQQSVFITKQTAGPKGAHGLPLSCVNHIHDTSIYLGREIHDCSIQYKDGEYSPYKDNFGRTYTGHWKLPYGKENLKTNVTKMLDIDEDTKIHMIGVHLHPFAQELSLWDLSLDSLLYSAEVKADSTSFSFEKISFFRSEVGIPVYQNHNYELRTTYNCTDSIEDHTAMAVMYLYLEDK